MGVLDGLRVIDSTQALAGPYCGMILGDLGADVIKVERPMVGDAARGYGPPFLDGESIYFISANRNKRGITLDYGSEAGRRIMHQLLASADVFMINIPKEEVLRRYGLEYDLAKEINPRLIYCLITGYGANGPYAGKPGFDLIAQGESGVMSVTGEPEGAPQRYPVPIADLSTGVFAAMGILAAIIARERTGKGQFIDASLLDSQVSWLSILAAIYLNTGQGPNRLGNLHPTIVPYQPFQARDKHLMVTVGTEDQWRRLCRVLGLEETIMEDERFANNAGRSVNRVELISLLADIFVKQDAAYWVERLEAEGIPCGPINSVEDALGHPQILARNMIISQEHEGLKQAVKVLASPLHLSDTPVEYRRASPTLGQHNEEVLASLGYSLVEIDQFRNEGVI